MWRHKRWSELAEGDEVACQMMVDCLETSDDGLVALVKIRAHTGGWSFFPRRMSPSVFPEAVLPGDVFEVPGRVTGLGWKQTPTGRDQTVDVTFPHPDPSAGHFTITQTYRLDFHGGQDAFDRMVEVQAQRNSGPVRRRWWQR